MDRDHLFCSYIIKLFLQANMHPSVLISTYKNSRKHTMIKQNRVFDVFGLFGQVSLADIAVSSVLEHLTGDDMTALVSANKPVSDLINRVKELPNIKAWIESRPATQF